MKSNSWVRPDYHENLKNELIQHLPEMGTNIVFEDNTWFLDRLKRSPGESDASYTLYYSSIPTIYIEISKYFVIMRYCEKRAVRTIQSNLYGLTEFFRYLKKYHNCIELHMVNKLFIKQYELYLRESDNFKKSTKEGIFTGINNFFNTMKGWEGMPSKAPILRKNPFSRSAEEKYNSNKYIPEYIINQLDIAFENKKMPIYKRIMYWLLRSIPSRVTEVCSMKIDCLKPSYKDGTWVIFIPTWKQSGGYKEPELRTIHIKYEGHGKFLIDLLREQQMVSEAFQEHLKNTEKGMLFTYKSCSLNGYKYNKNGIIEYNVRNKSDPIVANNENVRRWFNAVCRINKVINKKDEPYTFTSHQLRHNGITDRFYEGFSLIEIRDMTGHKNNEMINTTYIHDDPEKLIEIQRSVNEKTSKDDDKCPVYFKGKILNMDTKQEARLLTNPRANRLGKLGICRDITNCKSKLFECLDCDLFIPNASELEYFEEQVLVWTQKIEKFKKHQFMRENAEYNLHLHKSVVAKIKTIIKFQEGKNNVSKA